MLKAIAGHTSARGICRYLTKKDRALAEDYLNIDAPEGARGFDWAAVMDETRRAFGNDLPWRGKRVRTYKHYVVSPNPKDGAGLSALRELATAWAEEHFSEFEVAIVYHDDNERGIPHAHVVVNNTNIETGRRLQDPDPKALAESLQSIAERQGLTALRPPEATGVAARAQRRVSATAKSAERATLSRRRRPRFPAGGATALWPPALPRAAAQGALDRGVVEVRGPDLNLQRRGALGVPGRDRPARDLPSAELREPDRHRDVLCAERGQPPRGVRGPHDCPLSGSPSPSAASASRSFMR